MYASLALIPMPISELALLSITVVTPLPDIIYGHYCIYLLNKALYLARNPMPIPLLTLALDITYYSYYIRLL